MPRPSPVVTPSFRFTPGPLDGVVLIEPRRRGDGRGWLAEVYNAREFSQAGIETVFAQENQSWSRAPGTMRGLHYLARPVAKLLRVCAGRVVSACVDVRPESPSFGAADTVELSAEDGRQLFMDAGFAHGVCTLEPGTVIAYQLSGHHDPALERGLRWNDPDLGIDWRWPAERMIVSEKDAGSPLWAELRAGHIL